MSSHILLAAWNCPECNAVNYGIPECNECDWVDPEWAEWEKEQEKFWKAWLAKNQSSNQTTKGVDE